MSRHDLQVSTTRRPEVITPTVVDETSLSAMRRTGDLECFSQSDRGVMAKTVVSSASEIARMIVSTKCDVATIKANAEAEVDKINDSHPRFKKIAHVIIRKREFDKTTALKIRRFVEDNKRA